MTFDAHIVVYHLYLDTEYQMLQQNLYLNNEMFRIEVLFRHALNFQLLMYIQHLRIFPSLFSFLLRLGLPRNSHIYLHIHLTFDLFLLLLLLLLHDMYVFLAIKIRMNVRMDVLFFPNEPHSHTDYLILVGYD